jgi:hypothetical protein
MVLIVGKFFTILVLIFVGSSDGLFLERLELLLVYGMSLEVDPNFLLGVAIARGEKTFGFEFYQRFFMEFSERTIGKPGFGSSV